MAKQAKGRPLAPIIDEATATETIPRADFDRAMNLAEEMAKRIAELEAVTQDLISHLAPEWTNHAGALFGIGGGAVLRAMATLGIPRRAKLAPRLAHKGPPLIGEFALGDFIQIGDRICRIQAAARRKITLKIVGKVE